MKEKSTKLLAFPSPVPAKADYQRVKSAYSSREIKQLFGLSERTIRRWTEQGIIQASIAAPGTEPTYDFQALTQFRRGPELRAQGQSIRQIEAELQGQLHLFRSEGARVARLLTPFEEALLLHEQGDPKAAECYAEAISEGDNIAEAHYNLANLYYDASDLQLARLHYEAAIQIEPNFSLVYFNLALVYHRLGNLPGATAALEKYRHLEPDDDEIVVLDQLLKAMRSPRP